MLLMLLVFGAVVGSDQLAKAMIMARLDEGASTADVAFGVRLRHVINRRKPWGSIRAVRVMAVMWLLLGAAAVLVAIRIDTVPTYVALGALLGGAMGNLVDGISRKSVTDFIDLRVWPVFNIADTAIVGGAVLMIWTAFVSGWPIA